MTERARIDSALLTSVAALLLIAGCASQPAPANLGPETAPIAAPQPEPPPAAPLAPIPSAVAEPGANPDLQRLSDAIATYEDQAAKGGWPFVPAVSKLQQGDRGATVAALRARLAATGDANEEGGDQFDAALSAELKHFQERHGLEPDGILGRKTLAALNVPIASRIATLKLNLKHLQADRRQWGERYVVVNIAAASYRLIEGGTTQFERRVIVGRPNWPTPLLSGKIDEIIFHPTWTVPPNIARRELLPRIRREPGYLAAHHMKMVDGMIRQAAGPDNPLGKLKFSFPNDESVYLHDTNVPSLFANEDRFLSHGCIRLSNAEELARRLLAGEPGWNDDRITEKLAGNETERIALARPIPVHLVYETAWVDPDGTINFRNDAYARDSQ